MNKKIKIKNRILGENQPLFITAEIGITCNYDMGITKKLIDVVHKSGADAVKFIFWFPDEIMSNKNITYSYETVIGNRTENMYRMLQDLRFTLEEWKEIKSYADKKGIIIFSTVNSPSGITYTEEIGLEAYKLSSWDYNYHPLWRNIAKFKKPMLIDTGPVNTVEIAKVLQIVKEVGNNKIILVHCHHTDNYAEINMRAMTYLRKAFKSLVGYSSKNQKIDTDIVAIALGAVYLEKRLTLDRKLPGHHHIISLEPDEFTGYVRHMRNIQKALGIEDLIPSKSDLAERKGWFRHLVANKDIPKGTVLTENLLEGKRPEKGVSPEFIDIFIGRKTKRSLKENEAVSWHDVE